MNRYLLLLMTTFLVVFSASAQRPRRPASKSKAIVLQQDTTPSLLYQYYFGQLDSLNRNQYPLRYIAPNPYYYRLFTPIAFYYAPVKQINKMTWEFQPLETTADPRIDMLPVNKNAFTSVERTNK